MDCGEGTQRRFVEHGLGINREMVVLITHLHGDHVNGLLGLLQTMSMSRRGRKLTLVGPGGLYQWVKASMEMLHIGLSFDLQFVAARPGVVLRRQAYLIGRATQWRRIRICSRRPRVLACLTRRRQWRSGSPRGKSGRRCSTEGASP